jgi:hypothetical protein
MRRAIFLALALAPGLIHGDDAAALSATAAPLTPSSAAVAQSFTSDSLPDTITAVNAANADNSLLMHPGNWWMSVRGGEAYSSPYTNEAVNAAVQAPGTTYDLSSDQAGFGGVSLGRAFKHHWSVEAGGVLLEERHYHVRVEEMSLESDLRRDLQTGYVYLEASRHWSLGLQNTLSLGLQGGVGLLFETRHSQVPSQGLDTTELDSDIGAELSPLLRVDHYFDPWQSFGVEAGYRFFRFSKGSGDATDPLNFSGLTVGLRWSTWIGRGPLAPPIPNP